MVLLSTSSCAKQDHDFELFQQDTVPFIPSDQVEHNICNKDNNLDTTTVDNEDVGTARPRATLTPQQHGYELGPKIFKQH